MHIATAAKQNTIVSRLSIGLHTLAGDSQNVRFCFVAAADPMPLTFAFCTEYRFDDM
jgi:hypothetical protein